MYENSYLNLTQGNNHFFHFGLSKYIYYLGFLEKKKNIVRHIYFKKKMNGTL